MQAPLEQFGLVSFSFLTIGFDLTHLASLTCMFLLQLFQSMKIFISGPDIKYPKPMMNISEAHLIYYLPNPHPTKKETEK